MTKKRIIILASERSGTNLLRVLLGNHKNISAPVAVHFFNTFNSTIEQYGDLKVRDNAIRLITHFLKSANHPYTDWGLDTTADKIVDEYNVNSFEAAFDAIHLAFAASEGKNSYVCKDNDLYNHISLSEKLNLNKGSVYYIYLHRDPRDQVVSWLKTPLFLHTAYDIAKKWNKEQNIVNRNLNKINVFSLKYEDLIDDSKKYITDLLEYLDMEIDERCFCTNPNNQESKRNELWKNLSKPIIKGNTKKYIGKLSKFQIRLIETICKKNMLKLGYKLDTGANWKDYFNIYKKYILPLKRIKKRKEHKQFYEEKMNSLSSKLELLEEFKKEVDNG